MQSIKSCLLCCLLLASTIISGQTHYFDNYSVKQGLSQSTVYDLIQDHEGYVWLGTSSGLSRFDGHEFINYTSENGLAGNGIRNVLQDRKGNIWFGHTGGGISRLEKDSFEVITFDTLRIKINTDITSLAQDQDGNLWIGTLGNGVVKITNPDTSAEYLEFEAYKGENGISDRVFEVYTGQNKQVYFLTDVGIKVYDFKMNEFNSFKFQGIPTYFIITCIFEDSKHNMWLGTYNGGLYKFNKKSKKIKVYDTRDGLSNNWISAVAENKEGHIWVSTWGGGITRIIGDKLKVFNEDNGLHDIQIWKAIEDREGNILIGTNNSGLDIYKGDEFVAYDVNNGLPNEQVNTMVEDERGRIWLGTNSGIAILNEKAPDGSKFKYINKLLSDDHIDVLRKDEFGNIWVGTNEGGVMRFNLKNLDNFEYMTAINPNVSNNLVTAMDVDRYNQLWVGTLDGLIKYKLTSRNLQMYTQTNGLSGNDISAIYCDRKGAVWVGSKGKGLNKIVKGKIEQIDIGGEITINSMVHDKKGALWIGTDGQGLLVYDEGKVINHYKTSDGLLANLITLVNVDDEDNIWIGSNKGLNKYVKEEDRFYTYEEKDGFTGIESKREASYKDSDGNVWFGTVNGVMKYHTKFAKKESFEPLTHIVKLEVNSKVVGLQEKKRFSHNEKSFKFYYNSIYLTNPSSVRYKVMLEGVDEDWSEITNITFANYPALPPGDYVFKVKAGNGSGTWNNEPVAFKFTINPPFWQTWWFYTICLILIVNGVAYFIKKREESLRREKKILEDTVAMRTAEVVQKNDELAGKNRDITASIRYAKRIQNAVLPPDAMINKTLEDSFILFRPKDIVSGDFYWVAQKEDKTFFSAVDCTGHGVPGAFMSIIGHNSLDKIVGEKGILEPSKILDELNQSVSQTLRQDSEDSSIRDGMDIALISLDKEKMELEFAGAHNPLYIIREGEIIEIKADKFAIGSYRQERKYFQNHVVKLQKKDVIYVFSDGYADQFGGPLGKKFKYRPFKELLISLAEKPINDQKEELEKVFVDWMGEVHEQIDDVLIIGVRV